MRHALRNILIAIVAVVALALAALATPPGHGLVAGMIARAASGNGLTVSVSGVSGWPPFWLGAGKATLADAKGAFAEIDGLAIDIHTTALLRGALAFDAIHAGRVAVARRPELPGGGSGGALAPFAAEAVSVDRLELGAALAGRPAVLSLKGALTSGANGALSAEIDAERIDGRSGALKGAIARASAAAPFTADISLAEDADGVLAGLMGRAAAPAYRLAAKTAIDGDALDGTVSLQSSGAAHFDGRFALSPADDGGQHIAASGDGDLAELVPPEYGDLLSGPINLAVDADWTNGAGGAPPRVAIRQAKLSTGTVRATASGAFGDAAAGLALTLDVAKADGGPIALPLATPTHVGTIALMGKTVPAANATRFELTGQVAGLASGTATVPGLGVSLAVEGPATGLLAGGKLPFSLRLEASALETATGRIDSVAGAPLIFTADGTVDTAAAVADGNAKLAIAGGNAAFAGTLSAEGAKGTLTAAFADLKPLAPIVGRPVSGALDARADGTFAAEMALKVAGTASDLGAGDARLARLLAGETQFAATLTGSPARGIVLSDASIKGAALAASGNLSLAPDTIDGKLDGSISDLSLLADASTGGATLAVTISGARAHPTVAAMIAVPAGRLFDQPVANAVVQFDGAPAGGGWQGTLALTGAVAGKPLGGTATASLDAGGLFAFPAVDLAIGDDHIRGVVARTADGPLSGTLTVDAPNLRALAALALVEASGSGSARVEFKPDGARQSLAVTFSGKGLGSGGIGADSVAGDLAIDDAFGTPQVSGNATAGGVTAGSLRLDTASLAATVVDGATRFTAKATGRDMNLSGSGSLTGGAAGRTVRIAALSGSAFGLPVALSAPVAINFAAGQSDIAGAGIAGASLALGGGSVRLDGAVSPTLNLVLVADNVAAAVANGFAPALGAEGAVSGRATITGTTAAPAIAWSANWADLRVAASRNAGLPPLALSASGNATLAATSLSARLTGGGLALAIDGQVPFRGGGLALKATGAAPLALLALQSSRELRLAGTANLNLTLSGALAAPAIAGTADLVGATAADSNSGFGISGASGRITFDGQRATIAGLSGHLAQGGDITVSGSVAITGAGLPADLTIHIANGRYADGKIVNALFNADLAVKGPLIGNGTISGRIDLGRTEIQLPDRLAGAATAIDVQHVNAPPGFTPPRAREAVTAGGAHGGGLLNLNIALAANSGLFVRGFGIDSELGGTLTLTGTSGNPQTAGAFQMSRGRIEMLGRRFDFQSGSLTFNGDLVPVLNFTGTTTTTDGTVTLTVTGPANAPQISFTSSPALPQEEVLSRLLFDRNVGSLSPLQAAQLVDAVAQLTGALGGSGLFDRVREATGLDDLDLRQSATGGTTVGVGKRLNDRLEVGVEAGSDPGAGRVIIDLDITKNLKARGEAGQAGEGKVGLTYEREY